MPAMIRAASLDFTSDASRRAAPRPAAFWAVAAALDAALSAALSAALAIATLGTSALADERYPGKSYVDAVSNLEHHELAGLALFLGVLCFAVVTAVILVRNRDRMTMERARSRAEVAALEGEIDRLAALLLMEPQIIVAWDRKATPQIIGDPSFIAADLVPDRVLNYASWLRPEQAFALETAVERLVGRGESFSIALTTAGGRYLNAEGRAIAGCAVLKLHDVSGLKRDLADLAFRHQKLQGEVEALHGLLDGLPSPAWARDKAGRLTFVNPAYARAVGAPDAVAAVTANRDLLDGEAHAAVEKCRAAGTAYAGRAQIMIAGARRSVDIFEVPTTRGSAGLVNDATELESMRGEIARTVESHRRTLDLLATGVAMFGADQKLIFYNSSYRKLWGIEAAFLDERPTDSAVLDRLRAARLLPEQQDFRAWKGQFHQAYRASGPTEYQWHLPDLRTLRVVTTPNPDGGVTYLFDDVTERLNLERRFDALIRVQGETLDNLSEAVALFGSDGKVRLFNPVFANMWQLSPALLAEHPHIEAVIDLCRPFHDDETTWQALRTAVTALDKRDPISRRLERIDGVMLDCCTVPLPDGATLVTFQDVTDSVNVERALIERNEALVAADAIKIDFVHHVSYELRSPLTNIIGFAHFLDDPSVGPLTAKQHEYLGYITASSNALLAIINNILDLASIGAGAMTLDLEQVDIRATMAAAAEGVQDRLVKNNITLDIIAPSDIGAFTADDRRIRQILFNLLSNAVDFSPPGETVTLMAMRTESAMILTVGDHGPGISSEIREKVFDWFEADNHGTRHSGAGLGLSIVRSFVELHGGTVRIESVPGQGTTVVCTFPLPPKAERDAAE